MTATPVSPAKPARGVSAGIIVSALTRRGQERFTGTMRLDGTPGGTMIIRDGRVVAAATSAAPGPESLLLRSGRIAESDWSQAFAAAAPHGRLPAELAARGLLGAAGAEVLARTATVDAAFAMALCGVRTCAVEPPDPAAPEPLLPVSPGLDTAYLIREITRRLGMVAGWRELGLTLRARPRAADVDPERVTDPARREILRRANGRRTPRDIAFTVGRGLYPVMTDLATLLKDGLITNTTEPSPDLPAPPPPATDPPQPDTPTHWHGQGHLNDPSNLNGSGHSNGAGGLGWPTPLGDPSELPQRRRGATRPD